MAATTLYVIEDHSVVREGIRMLLEAAGDMRVAGTAAGVRAAVPDLERSRPDVILLDLDLGDEDGLDGLPRIQAAAPDARVLVLTALRDPGRDEAALRAGARGFVRKDSSAEEVLRAVRAVAAGELWFEPRVLASGAGARERRTPAALASLSARERDVVALVAQGLRNEEIARRLGINEKTVRNHLTGVFDKLGVSSRLELVVFAFRHGLVRVRR